LIQVPSLVAKEPYMMGLDTSHAGIPAITQKHNRVVKCRYMKEQGIKNVEIPVTIRKNRPVVGEKYWMGNKTASTD